MFKLSKVKSKYVLASGHNYEIALETERNSLEVLIVECVSWLVATIVTVGFFCLYTKFVCPEVWSYIVMNKSSMASIALIVAAFVFAVHFGYNNYQEKKQLQKDKTELYEKIEQLEQNIAKNNQIIADNEQSKRELENQSIERQEQINERLKNNNCANEYVPVSVADGVYNRAKNIRYSANPGESTR
jgi:glucan phosphoethanolaminetransferase (alkaline phosphatase superfamily)